MSIEDDNVARIKDLYRQYAQGEIEPVFAALADDVCWHSVGPDDLVPWTGQCTGIEGVKRYFQSVRDHVTVESYEPQYFIAQGDRVVAIVKLQVRDNESGRASMIEKADVFRLRDGKIAEFTEFGDMAAVANLRLA